MSKPSILDVKGDTGLTQKELKKINDLKEEEDMKGVIYISRVPPFMKPEKVKHLMSSFGEIGRVFLKPEDEIEWKKRKKNGGNRDRKYIDGWIEFANKKIARRVAESLNGTPIGGKKRHNFWREDIWALRYLPKFKWHNLSEFSFYKKSVREDKIRTIMSTKKKEHEHLLTQVEKKRQIEKMTEKREAKRRKLLDEENNQSDSDDDDDDDDEVSDYDDDDEEEVDSESDGDIASSS